MHTPFHPKIPAFQLLMNHLSRILILPTMTRIHDNIATIFVIFIPTRNNHTSSNRLPVGALLRA
ncbi:hypothetical protein HanRHA438_Chr11g0516081 [Helianthus annuus]|nr:hypothetical protein HanRHA438_Chr11g0516081 [Helianthus annuus]